MKRIIWLIALFASIAPCKEISGKIMKVQQIKVQQIKEDTTSKQVQEDLVPYYEKKIKAYSKVQKYGAVTIGSSLPAVVLGTYMVAEYDWDWHRSANLRGARLYSQGVIGVGLLTASASMLITGVVLNVIGRHKGKEYIEKAENMPTISFQKNRYNCSLSFTMNF